MSKAYFWEPVDPKKHIWCITCHRVQHYGYVGWYDEYWMCRIVRRTWRWWIFSWTWYDKVRVREVSINEIIYQNCLGEPIEVPDDPPPQLLT
jgi:hypothetical protein